MRPRSSWSVLASVAIAMAAAGEASGQVVRERLVPLDTAGNVLEIGPELRRTLGLFEEVRDFQSARLLESGSGYVLEITVRVPGGTVARERRSLSAGEVAELRLTVSSAMAARGVVRFERDGRAGLILTSTLMGLGFYGWAVPSVLDLEDRAAVGAYLLTAGSSFLIPYAATSHRAVSRPQRNAAAWGATRGVVYGLALGDALTGGEEDGGNEGSNDADINLAVGMATSILGGVLGFAYGGRPGVDEGWVAFRATMGDFMLVYGFGASTAMGLYDRDPVCELDVCVSDNEPDATPEGHLVSLGLAAAGTWAAGRWPGAHGYTLGDSRALRSWGLLGAQAAWPIWAAAVDDQTDDGSHAKSFAAATVLGSAAGLVVGDRLLRDRQLSSGDGLLVLAGHVAGGLGALGIMYLLQSDSGGGDHEVAYLSAAAAGSVAGSWLTLRAVGNDAPEGDRLGARDRAVRLEAAPLSIAAASLLGSRSGPRMRTPLLTLRF